MKIQKGVQMPRIILKRKTTAGSRIGSVDTADKELADGKEITMVEWFQDEDCKIKNTFIKDDTEARMASFSAIVNSK